MSTLLVWKVFISLLEKRIKGTPFVIYGKEFPSLSFCLPEDMQKRIEVHNNVYLIIPKMSHIDTILESMSSVVDIEWEGSSGSETFKSTGITIVKSPYENGESSGEIHKPASIENSYLGQLNKNRRIQRYPFAKFVELDLEYTARVNKTSITFNIQKWNIDKLDDILEKLHVSARFSSEIPIVHNGTNFEIPDIFSERYKNSLNSNIQILKGKQEEFPFINDEQVKRWLIFQK